MKLPTIPKKLPTVSAFNRLSRKHKISAVGGTAAAAVVLAVVGVEATTGAGAVAAAGNPTGFSVSSGQHVKDIGSHSGLAPAKTVTGTAHKADLATAAKKHTAHAAKKAAAHKAAVIKKHAAGHKVHAAKKRVEAAASRSAHRVSLAHPAKAHAVAKHATKSVYANNLDGWIRQSLAILHEKHIPASYEGIHRNIMRESSGNPKAINLWDINARNGIPSKGLLQVINPTFAHYHVAGTSWNIYNPVANITAACNYAADRYGSMDNVNSAY